MTPGPSANSILEETEAVICRIVRGKLRVTLQPADGRENNLDALDLLGAVRLKLLRKCTQGGSDEPAISDWASYAATVTYNTCNDYLRAKYPQRTRLKNALRRLVDKADGYASWPDASGELFCGFAGHRNRTPDSTGAIALRNDSSLLSAAVLAPQPLDSFSPAALLKLVDAIFEHVSGPVALDHLIAIVESVWGVEDRMDESLSASDAEEDAPAPIDRLVSTDATPDSLWLTRQRLALLWGGIVQLLPGHRAAYLLNLRDGELDSFPYYGVASLEEIGECIALTDQQFAILADSLGLAEDLRGQASILVGSGQKFVIYFRYLPLDDLTIAKVLGVTRAQVIAYRNKGIERLRRNLRGAL